MMPTKEDLPRVRELLKQQEHTWTSLAELLSKTRLSPALALGLGRAYVESGTPDDRLRALSLGALITAADQTVRYGTDWWNGELLILCAILEYAKSSESAKACDLGLNRCRDHAALGLLDRSPLRAEIIRLRSELEELAKGGK